MSTPLVSILLPAYRERFFADAFASARAQTLPDVEIVVSDDSPGEAIGRMVAAQADPRVRYERNAPALGFAGNFTRCLALARGRYVKFLNDDDRLHPRCVEAQAAVLEANPTVSLATSRRQVIDESGVVAADVPATTPLAHVSAFMPGLEVGDFCLVNGLNFVGEPTTVMFRRDDARPEDGSLFRWAGRDYHCLADLSLWLRLMARGLVHYGAAPLSQYRRHGGQEQRRPDVALGCLRERAWILQPARAAGYVRTPELRDAARGAVAAMAQRLQPAAVSDAAIAQVLGEVRTALDGLAG